jgi:hypothetical protein
MERHLFSVVRLIVDISLVDNQRSPYNYQLDDFVKRFSNVGDTFPSFAFAIGVKGWEECCKGLANETVTAEGLGERAGVPESLRLSRFSFQAVANYSCLL